LAMQKGREVSDEARLKVWFRRTARLKALEALRQKRRATTPFSDDTLEQLEVEWLPYDQRVELSDSAIARMLQACMDGLTDNQRRLLGLRYASGLQSGEIAKRLKMNVKTVYQAITRAHRSLVDCIQRKRVAAMREGDLDE
jgi:RNA polymerase sigma-70 factor, ECF subfamily